MFIHGKIMLMFCSVIAILLACGVIGTFACSLIQPHNQVIVVTLKTGTNIETQETEILKIPHVKKIKVKTKEDQWSNYVNKWDLPKMENPFKDTIIIRVDKQKNIEEVFEKVSQKDYVEKADYSTEADVYDGLGKAFIKGI